MQCLTCKRGHTHPGIVNLTIPRGESLIIFKQGDAEVGENCGEYYLSKSTSQKLLQRAEEAVKNGAEVEIVRFTLISHLIKL